MTFSQMTQEFDLSPPGTDAFLAVKEGTRNLMKTDPAHASAHFLIHGFARNYVILHDDEPITREFAEASKQQLLGYMKMLDAAVRQGDAAMLQAMNSIVTHYIASTRPF